MRMSKLEEVAKLAGVSKSTVSRVINGSDTVSPEARQKVQEAMQSLRFHTQQLKRATEASSVLGLIMPLGKQIASHSFGIEMMAGVEEKAFENDYMILIGNSVGGRDAQLTASMVQRGVEGLIMLSGRQEQFEHLQQLQLHNIPLVLLDQKLEGLKTHLVRGDNFMGAVTLIAHLLEIGHRRIGIVSPNRHSTHKDRIKGYRYALMEQGIRIPDSYEALEGNGMAVDELLWRMLDGEDRPSALFVTNPGLLGKVVNVLNRKGLRIPEHISVVTFDECYAVLPEEYQDFFTSINQPAKLMGSMAVEILFRHKQNPELGYQEIVLPGTFAVRRSTLPAH